MLLYIRTPEDDPHAADDTVPEMSRCGVVLYGTRVKAVSITEAQALIHLGNRRCAACFPGWAHTIAAAHRRH